ncbi:putative manganese-dependent inorganic diphosphatase [Youngiibacter multivorans]|uniref:inorganic diphosphatase n=1 Tax=Youngiibacter multivorans TaxID=937251 RepID=A0ABS4G4P1_9CLOT|nr:putative manganese-dependent inorganic diphosphatase [Youngiibacter multivorans]MBP1919504.1 manganese-dependent inorganic pyrophosphatase [Youngiibacter multivorans]
MKDTVFVTGHKNPDSDSICAALAYAEFKNKTGTVDAIPVRLGEINRETSFILSHFEVEPPMLIETVKLQVKDMDIDKITPVSPDITLKMAWNLMRKQNVKSLPVIDDNELLMGVVSVTNVTESYMDVWDNTILGKANVTLENIIDTLTAKPVSIEKSRKTFSGKILVLSGSNDTASKMLEEGDIAICGDRVDSQELCIDKKVALIIVTTSNTMSPELLEKARENKVTILSTPYDTFTTARLITQAVPVRHVMGSDKLIYFSSEDYIEDIRGVMAETRYRSYPVVSVEGKVAGTVSRYHLISAKKKKVILVDHNERGQSVDGLEDAEILEIIDHHRVADVATGTPIYFRNEPVGSTSTIVANIFFENGIRPSKKIAGILCAAIISDTLLFRSPTATNVDRMTLERLAMLADIDVNSFALEMFKYGTSLAGRSPDEILNQDFKVFSYDDEKVGVAQVYSMDADSIMDLKEPLIEAMDLKARTGDFTMVALILTDIYKEGSEIIAVGKHKELINKAFNVELVNNSVYIPGILSRKKQVIPPLTAAINR